MKRSSLLFITINNDTSSHPNAQSSSFIFNNSKVDNNYYIRSENDLRSNIKNNNNFNDLLVILDIRMKNLNGFQLHQQIKSIDPIIKVLFVTALDILNESSSIVPGISKDQIMRKPVDKKIFTNTVKKLVN
jgi:two-component SAPR family response regulator